MDENAVIETLKSFLLDDASAPLEELDADTDLFESGVVDSLKILSLVVFVEERYGLNLGPDDLTEENFKSLNALSGLINHRQVAAT